MKSSIDTKDRALLQGLVVGGIVGGVATWLFAPRSIIEVRNQMYRQMRLLPQQTGQTVSETRSAAHEGLEKARTTIRLLMPGESQK